MNELSIFSYCGSDVRTTTIDGDPWFFAIDIARILGYVQTNSMSKKLDADEVKTCPFILEGQVRHLLVVNESGLYTAILRSTRSDARKFRKWVTGEVLPSIRKTGTYAMQSQMPIDVPKTYGEALLAHAKAVIEIEKKDAILEYQRPKVEQWDQIVDSGQMFTINDVAKSLETTQIAHIGSIKLFCLLRDKGILLSSKAHHNEPAQRYIDNGCFVTKIKPIAVGTASQNAVLVTLVTPKGIKLIADTLKGMPAEELYKYGKAHLYAKEEKHGFPALMAWRDKCHESVEKQTDIMEVI